MQHVHIIVTLLILFQTTICMELNTKVNKTTYTLKNIPPKKNIMAQQINKKISPHSDPITNEIIEILQLNSLVEMKAIVAHEKGDQKNIMRLDKKVAQCKRLKKEEQKCFQEERKKCLQEDLQKYFQQKQQSKEVSQNIPAKIKTKKKKKKPQINSSLNKKTEYTLPNLPIPPTNIKPTTNIKPVKTKLQQVAMVKRILIRDNSASNEADLKRMLTDFCHKKSVPCMFRTFNTTIAWHYDKQTNDLSILFNDDPCPCEYDHSSQDSSSD